MCFSELSIVPIDLYSNWLKVGFVLQRHRTEECYRVFIITCKYLQSFLKPHGVFLLLSYLQIGEKVSEKKLDFEQGWTNEKDTNKARMTTLLWNDGSLQRNAFASIVHFAHDKVNQGCKCIALGAREEAAIILQQGSVLEFSHPCLVSVLFIGPFLA